MRRWSTTSVGSPIAYTFSGFHVNRRVANERRQATDKGTRGNWHGVVGNHKQTAANGILFFSSLVLVKRTRSRAVHWQLGAESSREAQITSLGIIYSVPLAWHITGSWALTIKYSLYPTDHRENSSFSHHISRSSKTHGRRHF